MCYERKELIKIRYDVNYDIITRNEVNMPYFGIPIPNTYKYKCMLNTEYGEVIIGQKVYKQGNPIYTQLDMFKTLSKIPISEGVINSMFRFTPKNDYFTRFNNTDKYKIIDHLGKIGIVLSGAAIGFVFMFIDDKFIIPVRKKDIRRYNYSLVKKVILK